mmetsp:Transcript_76462/g.128454  ORF Transcript_76462/g.128454 Transcript_76462/m.128454 type:complete len:95 (+) Transcript_76462:326-610(+)
MLGTSRPRLCHCGPEESREGVGHTHCPWLPGGCAFKDHTAPEDKGGHTQQRLPRARVSLNDQHFPESGLKQEEEEEEMEEEEEEEEGGRENRGE